MLSTITAVLLSKVGIAAIGVVVGHFLGDYIWQPIKHGATWLYQWAKHKITG